MVADQPGLRAVTSIHAQRVLHNEEWQETEQRWATGLHWQRALAEVDVVVVDLDAAGASDQERDDPFLRFLRPDGHEVTVRSVGVGLFHVEVRYLPGTELAYPRRSAQTEVDPTVAGAFRAAIADILNGADRIIARVTGAPPQARRAPPRAV